MGHRLSEYERLNGRLGLVIVPLCRGTGAPPPPSTNTGAPWALTGNITGNYQ